MQNSVRRAIAGVLALVLLTLCMPAMAASKLMKTCKAAKVYARAKTSSKVVVKLDMGEKVTVTAVSGNWARVLVDGTPGYMAKTALVSASSPVGKTMYTARSTVLRNAAKASGKKLKTVPAGEAVTLLAYKGSWTRVKYSGKTGYILKKHLTASKPATGVEEQTPPSGNTDAYDTLKPGDKGEAVKKLQTRLKELNWFFGEVGGNYLTLTTQAVKDFQDAAKLSVTGIADAETQRVLYSDAAPKNRLGESTASPASGPSQEMDWWKSDIQRIFARNTVAVVTDVKTGISWKEVRSGGTNHADVQPCTAADAAAMKRAYGGSWSWERRAIWVSIDGKRYAASMNGMPHGNGSITTNNFDGHHCIHFTNSRTHGSNKVDAAHQNAIKQALAAG